VIGLEAVTAQDVVDAIRFALSAQDDPAERLRLVDGLLERAPVSRGDRGLDLLMGMIAGGAIKVTVA
jgi:hypothetical protein